MKQFIQLNRLIIFFIGSGLLILAFEIYLQHYELLSNKKITWLPIIFGICGGVLILLIALFFNRFSYYLFFALMIISVLVGVLGLYLHNKWRLPALTGFLLHGKVFDFKILTTYTPLFAPSAFIAIGILGILVGSFQKSDD